MSNLSNSTDIETSIKYININDKESNSKTVDFKYCSICLSDIECNASTTLNCHHCYHTECYTSYIAYNIVHKKEKILCPVCRDDIIQVIIHDTQTIEVMTNNNHLHDDNNSQETNMSSSRCCNSHNLILNGLKTIMIMSVFFVVYFSIECGGGVNNVLCKD